jgi:hypothetical protein
VSPLSAFPALRSPTGETRALSALPPLIPTRHLNRNNANRPAFYLPKTEKKPNFDTNQAMPKRTKKSPAETRALIRSLRGSLKGKLGDKPFAEWWAELKAEERELEERRDQCLSAMISNGQRRKMHGGNGT